MMLSLLDILTRGEVAGAMGFNLGIARVEKGFFCISGGLPAFCRM